MVATRRNATAENIENSPFNPYGSEIPENIAGKNIYIIYKTNKSLKHIYFIFYLIKYKKYHDGVIVFRLCSFTIWGNTRRSVGSKSCWWHKICWSPPDHPSKTGITVWTSYTVTFHLILCHRWNLVFMSFSSDRRVFEYWEIFDIPLRFRKARRVWWRMRDTRATCSDWVTAIKMPFS